MAAVREAERQKSIMTAEEQIIEEAIKADAVDYSASKVPHFKMKEEEPDDGFPSIEFDEDVEIIKFKYFPQVENWYLALPRNGTLVVTLLSLGKCLQAQTSKMK